MTRCGCMWIVNIVECVVVRILWSGFVNQITLRLLAADTDMIIFHLSGIDYAGNASLMPACVSYHH